MLTFSPGHACRSWDVDIVKVETTAQLLRNLFTACDLVDVKSVSSSRFGPMTTLPLGPTDLAIWISKLSHCIVKLSRVSTHDVAGRRLLCRTWQTLQRCRLDWCWKFSVPQLSQCLLSFSSLLLVCFPLRSFYIIFYPLPLSIAILRSSEGHPKVIPAIFSCHLIFSLDLVVDSRGFTWLHVASLIRC